MSYIYCIYQSTDCNEHTLLLSSEGRTGPRTLVTCEKIEFCENETMPAVLYATIAE